MVLFSVIYASSAVLKTRIASFISYFFPAISIGLFNRIVTSYNSFTPILR
nr:MAG TPA: hypothetical protein [Caudoviricetes sp.]